MGWLLFREIGDLVDGDKWGWSTLGDRERLISVVLPDTCSLTSILGLGDHSVVGLPDRIKPPEGGFGVS